MFVKPAPGRKVRWPGAMRYLSDQGEEVPEDFHWKRLVHTKDVLVVPSPTEPKKPSTAIMKKEQKDD